MARHRFHPPRFPLPVLALALAVPFATLIAAAATLRVIGSDGLDAVGDRVQRFGRLQQADLGADRRAASLGLSAALTVRPEGVAVTLRGDAGAGRADRIPPVTALRLHLEHPIEARFDREIPLAVSDQVWRGDRFDRAVDWRVALAPADGGWRLVGRWPRGATRIDLTPALEPDHGGR